MMPKWIKRKPIVERRIYLKYGFVKTESTYCYCPRCNDTLNAGPVYKPKYCSECGQKLDFNDIKWEPDKELGYAKEREHEQIKDRVV